VVDSLPPDPIAPLQVDPLSSYTKLSILYSASSNSIGLRWTATGDDGNTPGGAATVYDLRYQIGAAITSDLDYQTAFNVFGELPPAVAGTPESFLVTGLSPDTTYCFAIKAVDEVGHASALDLTGPDTSTVCAKTEPIDNTVPSATVLSAALVPIGGGPTTYTDRVLLTWAAKGDDGDACVPDRSPLPCTAASYELRYSTSLITAANFSGATPVSGVPAPSATGTDPEPPPNGFTVTGLLSSEQPYFFAIKIKDEVPESLTHIFLVSNSPSVTLGLDTTPPADVTTLEIGTTITTSSISLTFSSPGDDATPAPTCPCGTPTYYMVRYSDSVITALNFDAATTFNGVVVSKGDGSSDTITVTGGIVPHAAGTVPPESITVTGLIPGTTYYFAVEAVDERGNQSGLGTVVSEPTLQGADTIPPGQINDLTVIVSSVTERWMTLQWTARGDDGDLVGAATAYDLRYSHKPITTNALFDAATQVAGEPIPAPPGTGQGMTVDFCAQLVGAECAGAVQHLTANTNYYFAIKAIDDSGKRSNLGTLTNTNIHDPGDAACTGGAIGGGGSYNCNLRTSLMPGFNVLSVPLLGPLSASILDALDGVADWCGPSIPCMAAWVSNGLATDTDSNGVFCYLHLDTTAPCPPPVDDIDTGNGYYLYTILTNVVVNSTDRPAIPGTPVGADFHRTLDPQGGLNLIGNPFSTDVPLAATSLQQTGGGACTLLKTFDEAQTAGWVASSMYVITNGTGDSFSEVPFGSAILQPWQGYWLWMLVDDCTYELVIPKP
jgi:chitodextrinase